MPQFWDALAHAYVKMITGILCFVKIFFKSLILNCFFLLKQRFYPQEQVRKWKAHEAKMDEEDKKKNKTATKTGEAHNNNWGCRFFFTLSLFNSSIYINLLR